MRANFTYFLVTFSAIFFIVDPLGLVPIFIAITAHSTREKRRAMAKRATLLAFGLLSFFAIFGGLVFRLFGITMPAMRMAGGFLLVMTAIDMLRAQPTRTRSSPEEEMEFENKADVAIVPLAMPLLAGPGSIVTVMVLAGRGGTYTAIIPVVISAALTCLIAYLLLRTADPIQRLLGRSGIAVLERIMGLLLAAIGVQFMVDGVMEVVKNLH
ncbi:MAG: Membrane protein, MarC family [Holophagaceae bacterium]|nr:Membrane protein, MarC family [Holophagaceae bacterium]